MSRMVTSSFASTVSRSHISPSVHLRSRRTNARIVSTRATIDDREAAVAQKLLHLEGELSFITQPGRIPPRAAVVAGIRKEISALRSELSNPGSVNGLDLTVPARAARPPATSLSAQPPVAVPVAPSAGSKAATSQAKKASGARNALLAIEKKLGTQANSAPLSEKAKNALEAIEGSMSSVMDASKNLTELETLQVENALLRTQLEVVMERKRHLSQLTMALRRGLIEGTVKERAGGKQTIGKAPAKEATTDSVTEPKKKSVVVV